MIFGVAVPRYPTRAHPHERGGKSLSLDLHGGSSTTNGIPVYGRGVTLPSPNKVQNAVDRSFRWNEGPHRLPQHIQEPSGATWIPRPCEMQSLCHHSQRLGLGMVQQAPASLSLILQGNFPCFHIPLNRSPNVSKAKLPPADHKERSSRKLEVLRPEVQLRVIEGGHLE